MYTFAKICLKSFSSDFSHHTSFTFQLLLRFDAMRPDVDSCMGKTKEMCTRSKFYDLKVGNLQEINKMPFPPDRYSNLSLNAYINRHVHAQYLNMIEFYSPLGIRHVLCSINTNKNENTYHFRYLQACRCHFIPESRRMMYRQYAQIRAKRHIHLPV